MKAVAQLDQDLFGREVKIRALIPIDSKGVESIHRVENCGVSGIVDFKLRGRVLGIRYSALGRSANTQD